MNGPLEFHSTFYTQDRQVVPKQDVQGVPKKGETWKTTWGLLTDILERIKGPSIKQICEQLK